MKNTNGNEKARKVLIDILKDADTFMLTTISKMEI